MSTDKLQSMRVDPVVSPKKLKTRSLQPKSLTKTVFSNKFYTRYFGFGRSLPPNQLPDDDKCLLADEPLIHEKISDSKHVTHFPSN